MSNFIKNILNRKEYVHKKRKHKYMSDNELIDQIEYLEDKIIHLEKQIAYHNRQDIYSSYISSNYKVTYTTTSNTMLNSMPIPLYMPITLEDVT